MFYGYEDVLRIMAQWEKLEKFLFAYYMQLSMYAEREILKFSRT